MIAVALTILIILFLGLVWLRRRIGFTIDTPAARRCICGYEYRGLDRARCPECGRVMGFDASPEELGLTDEELARAARKRQERGEL